MKKLNIKELRQVNGGSVWEDVGTIAGKVVDKIPEIPVKKK